MANSKFEYVKNFETQDTLLPNCWIVCRVDGRSFHKFCDKHKLEKPNDRRCISLMNKCALEVATEFPDVVIAFGMSDEYSFVLKRSSTLWSRRAAKINTAITSFFTSCFVFYWKEFFASTPLLYPPMFDGRVVCFPTDDNIKDYLAWRQADCHINNLYNTCFWALVHEGSTLKQADEELSKTVSSEKNELLFSRFGINYAKEPSVPSSVSSPGDSPEEKDIHYSQETNLENRGDKLKLKAPVIKQLKLALLHEDLIGPAFWLKYVGLIPHLSKRELNKLAKKKADADADGGEQEPMPMGT